MSWTVTERRYHGKPDNKFVVHWAGELRGPVETNDRAAADRIAAILNGCDCRVEFTGMRTRRYGWERQGRQDACGTEEKKYE